MSCRDVTFKMRISDKFPIPTFSEQNVDGWKDVKDQVKMSYRDWSAKDTGLDDEGLLEELQNEIDELTAKNAHWTSENKKLHEDVLKLERQLESVSKAIDNNLAAMTSSLESLNRENQELKTEFAEKQSVVNEIRQISKTLVEVGTDLSSVYGLDLGFLGEFCPEIHHKPEVKSSVIMDPEIFKVIMQYPEFSYCHSNEEVVEQCRLFLDDLRKNVIEEVTNDVGPAERLSAEVHKYHKASARAAHEMKELLADRDSRSSAFSSFSSDCSHTRGSFISPPYGVPSVLLGSGFTSRRTSSGRRNGSA
jgi:hypothetical protein